MTSSTKIKTKADFFRKLIKRLELLVKLSMVNIGFIAFIISGWNKSISFEKDFCFCSWQITSNFWKGQLRISKKRFLKNSIYIHFKPRTLFAKIMAYFSITV
jgi:hypothetical protein